MSCFESEQRKAEIHRGSSSPPFDPPTPRIRSRIPRPKAYPIPYGCLVPRDVGSLLVAGRAISADHQAQGSLRVMVIAMALGQAAGTAAALCARDVVQPRDLDVGLLQTELLCQGVNLGR